MIEAAAGRRAVRERKTMNKHVTVAALVAFGFAASGVAIAQTMAPSPMSSGAMGAQDDMSMRATMVCRPVHQGEKGTMRNGKIEMVCKSIGDMMQKPNMGPETSGGLTSDQINAAWQQYFRSVIIVPTLGGG
jgi:hypothetical protein